VNDPRFPIGKFSYDGPPSEDQRRLFISQIESLPAELRAAVKGLTPPQLDTPYRDGGWTVRQVVHHVPDSHLNAYIRFKLALTEEQPTVKTYEEQLWAELADVKSVPVEAALILTDGLHARFTGLLLAMNAEDWKRSFRHPAMGAMPLEKNLALYAWHGRHHTAHIVELRKRMGWN
jgi:hypothetical protein